MTSPYTFLTSLLKDPDENLFFLTNVKIAVKGGCSVIYMLILLHISRENIQV